VQSDSQQTLLWSREREREREETKTASTSLYVLNTYVAMAMGRMLNHYRKIQMHVCILLLCGRTTTY